MIKRVMQAIKIKRGNYWKDRVFESDHDTVSPQWDKESVEYHYAWTEEQIRKHLLPKHKTVLDIGSGYGHWLRFYRGLGMRAWGIEPSKPMAERLNVFNGTIEDYPTHYPHDVINAIGVLHHIMRDKDLIRALDKIKAVANGPIFIGTRFDFFTPPKEAVRKYRPLAFWEENLDIVAIERSNPNKLRKHLDLIVAKRGIAK